MSLPRLLGLVVGALDATGVPYMITGSIASSVHGAPRATRDLDIVIDPDAGSLEALVRGLQSAGLYVDIEAATAALRDRAQFNAIDGTSGWKIDLVVRKDRPFSKVEFERRRRIDLHGTVAWVASPEDMILVKLEWAAATDSDRQLGDVAAMVDVGRGSLDVEYLERWVAELGLDESWRRVQAAEDR